MCLLQLISIWILTSVKIYEPVWLLCADGRLTQQSPRTLQRPSRPRYKYHLYRTSVKIVLVMGVLLCGVLPLLVFTIAILITAVVLRIHVEVGIAGVTRSCAPPA